MLRCIRVISITTIRSNKGHVQAFKKKKRRQKTIEKNILRFMVARDQFNVYNLKID